MDIVLTRSSANDVRAFIARTVLGQESDHVVLGRITLEAHQREALGRLEGALTDFGGALLADEVGLGKTYVALAMARSFQRPIIVAPAALGDMWRQALADTAQSIPIISFELLSRSPATPTDHDFVIVDEAHHARNASSHRYRSLATLASNARILLLSATPIHNAPRELHALLALFLGARAESMSEEERARCIVRRGRSAARDRKIPKAAELRWLDVPGNDRILEALMSIPPPVATRNGTAAAALVQIGLMRAWSSSEAALLLALRRRLGLGAALTHALQSGRVPSRQELRAWSIGDDAVQLAFPELMIASGQADDRPPLLGAITEHVEGVRRALTALGSPAERGTADQVRITHLKAIRQRHPGERIIAFTQFAETARALYRGVAMDGRAALLTSNGGRIASGKVLRTEILAAFAPSTSAPDSDVSAVARQSRALPSPTSRLPSPVANTPARAPTTDIAAIELLIATDVISEGVNLQRASVIVHLDLPWTGARLAQRLGRIQRLGSRHDLVHVYAMSPPSGSEAMLRVIERLRHKLATALALVGAESELLQQLDIASSVLSSSALQPSSLIRRDVTSAPILTESVWMMLNDWRGRTPRQDAGAGDVRFAVVRRAPETTAFALALLTHGARAVLICQLADEPLTADPGTLLAVLGLASADTDERKRAAGTQNARDAPPASVARTVVRVNDWIIAQLGRRIVSAAIASPSTAHRQALRRIASLCTGIPRHLRREWHRAASGARQRVLASRGAGDEMALKASVDDARTIGAASEEALQWLARVAADSPSTSNRVASEGDGCPFLLRALLVSTDA